VLIKVEAFGLNRSELHGVVCFTGMLSTCGRYATFTRSTTFPRGVRLTAYTGEATDLQTGILQDFLHAVAAGEAIVPVHRVYQLDEIREAHAEMEAGSATGRIVVLTDRQPEVDLRG
jgi:NADPH:quinone reductase-like Zn-dependent oxidoreductase